MALSDEITASIADIDSKVADIKNRATSEVSALLARKAVLQQVEGLLTPQIEAAVSALEKHGFIKIL